MAREVYFVRFLVGVASFHASSSRENHSLAISRSRWALVMAFF